MGVEIEGLIAEFTRQLAASRDPQQLLSRVYRFFKKLMPVDFVNLAVYDPRLGTLHYQAFVSDNGVLPVDEKIRLSSSARLEAARLEAGEVCLIDNLNRHPITVDIIDHLGIADLASTIFVLTPLARERFGVLGFLAWGERRYRERHRRLLTGLYEPIAGAVGQIIAHFEILSQKERLAVANREFRKKLGYQVIGADTGLKEVMAQVEKVAGLDIPVLLTGETGVGKEVIANAIHNYSDRMTGPLVSINCGAIPENLVESELFGYEKGAFTGAEKLRRGYFEQADEGTIFLDEVGELSPAAQVKLLRFLQTLELRRLGGSRTITVDVRIIAATNRDIQVLVRENRFRADLWYRLNVFPIRIPPLRERRGDIPELAAYFARRQALEMNLPHTVSFASRAFEQFAAYDWPGNIRELKNVIERALITCQGRPLSFPDLAARPAPPAAGEPLAANETGFLPLDEMIATHIRRALKISEGRVEGRGGAAELLRLHPSTLRAKMRKLGIRIRRVAE